LVFAFGGGGGGRGACFVSCLSVFVGCFFVRVSQGFFVFCVVFFVWLLGGGGGGGGWLGG